MKCFWCCLMLLFAGAINGSAQSATPQPTPQVNAMPTPTPIRQLGSGIDRMMNRREAAQLSPAEQARFRNQILAKYVDPIYRKPTKEELAAVAVEPATLARFTAFLGLPNTGIFKLVKDFGCDQNTTIVSATDECRLYSMPGAGNSYSFRFENYRLRRLGDLSMRDGKFFVPGVYMHGILTVLGDADPAKLNLDSPGVIQLNVIEPSQTKEAATKFGAKLARGFDSDGQYVSATAAVKLNTTYALRAVAFRGKQMRAVVGATYNELERDKRRDQLVLFRVVEIDSAGSVTIIFRELMDKESPELKDER